MAQFRFDAPDEWKIQIKNLNLCISDICRDAIQDAIANASSEDIGDRLYKERAEKLQLRNKLDVEIEDIENRAKSVLSTSLDNWVGQRKNAHDGRVDACAEWFSKILGSGGKDSKMTDHQLIKEWHPQFEQRKVPNDKYVEVITKARELV